MVISEASVIARVRAGDVDAFTLLVDRYHQVCAQLALQLLGDPDDAADAVQEALIRAYNSLSAYEDRGRFGAWLMCIVANRCRSARHSSRRRAAAAAEWLRSHGDIKSQAGYTPPERDHALMARLNTALSQLPAETSSVVVRKYCAELSYEEIAAETGVGVSALKMRVARGSDQLRRTLAAAGVTAAAALLIVSAHVPRSNRPRPVTVVACDTLRALMRDTLADTLDNSTQDQMRDSLFAERCGYVDDARDSGVSGNSRHVGQRPRFQRETTGTRPRHTAPESITARDRRQVADR